MGRAGCLFPKAANGQWAKAAAQIAFEFVELVFGAEWAASQGCSAQSFEAGLVVDGRREHARPPLGWVVQAPAAEVDKPVDVRAKSGAFAPI